MSDREPGDAANRRGVLLVNTNSRRGRQSFGDAQRLLAEQGVALDSAIAFRNVKELISAAQNAIDRGANLVVVGGGDGTLSSVAPIIVRSRSLLGVLPLGTGNSFARDLGIPTDLEAACSVISSGMETAVDVGEVGDRQFLNLATVGLTSLIARQLNVKMKRRFGVLSYAIALFVALRKERPFRARIETESGVEEYDTLQVVIGNGRFHGGPFPLAPDAGIDTGRLVVYSLATRSKGAFLRLALALPTGRHVDLPDVKWQTCRGGRLSTTPSMKVDVDGELCMNTPVEFRELPGALRVIAPLDFTRTD